jgi:hypothetical protein
MTTPIEKFSTRTRDEEKRIIRDAVRDFFTDHKYVYATPGTDNHSANFYGTEEICRMGKRDVIGAIEHALSGWVTEDEDGEMRPMTVAEAIDAVISDLQYNRP